MTSFRAGGNRQVQAGFMPHVCVFHQAIMSLILVVDDDDQVRATIVAAVTALGYQVAEADSGEAAMAVLEASKVSLVILDYSMPGRDGAAVARDIAEVDPDLPIVFSTGHAALRALRTAAGDDVPILEKPFTLAELDQLLAERLALRRAQA